MPVIAIMGRYLTDVIFGQEGLKLKANNGKAAENGRKHYIFLFFFIQEDQDLGFMQRTWTIL